jgi:hypothetical protein
MSTETPRTREPRVYDLRKVVYKLQIRTRFSGDIWVELERLMRAWYSNEV